MVGNTYICDDLFFKFLQSAKTDTQSNNKNVFVLAQTAYIKGTFFLLLNGEKYKTILKRNTQMKNISPTVSILFMTRKCIISLP